MTYEIRPSLVVMQEVVGNIWDYLSTHWIVIPTNAGWKITGENIMGRGLAQQATRRFPGLAASYGEFCRQHPGEAKIFPIKSGDVWLIMLPTKPLNPAAPNMSWKGKSDINLIERCVIELSRFTYGPRSVALPALGCGLGGLKIKDVMDVLCKYLDSDDFLFVHEPPSIV